MFLLACTFHMCRTNPNITFPGFTRNDARNLSLEVARQLDSLEFTGVTGPVSFTNGNRNQTRPRVLQYRFGSSGSSHGVVEIGTIDVSNASNPIFMYVNEENNVTTWPACECVCGCGCL